MLTRPRPFQKMASSDLIWKFQYASFFTLKHKTGHNVAVDLLTRLALPPLEPTLARLWFPCRALEYAVYVYLFSFAQG